MNMLKLYERHGGVNTGMLIYCYSFDQRDGDWNHGGVLLYNLRQLLSALCAVKKSLLLSRRNLIRRRVSIRHAYHNGTMATGDSEIVVDCLIAKLLIHSFKS
jgi:hypothetical protein